MLTGASWSTTSLVLAAAVLELLVVAPGLADRCGGLLGVAPPPLRPEWARAAVADVATHEEADERDDCCGHQHQHQQHARQAEPRAAARRLQLRGELPLEATDGALVPSAAAEKPAVVVHDPLLPADLQRLLLAEPPRPRRKEPQRARRSRPVRFWLQRAAQIGPIAVVWSQMRVTWRFVRAETYLIATRVALWPLRKARPRSSPQRLR